MFFASSFVSKLRTLELFFRKVSSDDDSPFWMKRIFLLDCDVGQSELSPPGVISLNEITEPFFGKILKFFVVSTI